MRSARERVFVEFMPDVFLHLGETDKFSPDEGERLTHLGALGNLFSVAAADNELSFFLIAAGKRFLKLSEQAALFSH